MSERAGFYRTNLTGELTYKSFVPHPLPPEIKIDEEMIFFTFPTGNKRKILLHNIKGGLTIGELKELSKQVVEQRILLDAYNESSTGISHAAAVKSFDINKLGGQEPIKF